MKRERAEDIERVPRFAERALILFVSWKATMPTCSSAALPNTALRRDIVSTVTFKVRIRKPGPAPPYALVAPKGIFGRR